MAPAANMDNIHDNDLDVIEMASAELERLRGEFGKGGQSSSHQKKRKFPQFPAACMAVLKTEDENNRTILNGRPSVLVPCSVCSVAECIDHWVYKFRVFARSVWMNGP